MNEHTNPKKVYARPALKAWGTLTDLTKTDWAAMDADMRTGSSYQLRGRRVRRRRRRRRQNRDD